MVVGELCFGPNGVPDKLRKYLKKKVFYAESNIIDCHSCEAEVFETVAWVMIGGSPISITVEQRPCGCEEDSLEIESISISRLRDMAGVPGGRIKKFWVRHGDDRTPIVQAASVMLGKIKQRHP